MNTGSTLIPFDVDSSIFTSVSEDFPIIVEDLSKVYKLYEKPVDRLKESLSPFRRSYHRDFYALNNISFRLKKGEALGIIGRNGSGKSTLLKIITGILTPTRGRIEVHGKISALLELGAGFNPELSGLENIYFGGTLMGYSREQMDAKVDDILAFADIGKFISQRVKTYSSGMFVRLAFALAVNVDPEILIIDEALAVGDMRFSMKCIRKMKDLIAQGTSQIFVSHDMTTIMNFCNDVLWLHDGKIFQRGNPKRITTNYANFMTYGFLPPEMDSKEKLLDSNDEDYRSIRHVPQKSTGHEADPVFLDRVGRLKWFDLRDLPSVGEGGAVIAGTAIHIPGEHENRIVFNGGEESEVFLDIHAKRHLSSPVSCANFYDRKGNLIFGLNTLLYGPGMPEMQAGERVIVNFKFRVPLLLIGEYSMLVAVADGSLESHVQHHVVNDAVVVNVFSADLPRKHYMVAVDNFYCTCRTIRDTA